jgi:regulatory protein
MTIAPDDKAARPESKPQNKGKKERKPPKKITEKYLYNSGLYYLQRFPASSMHFKRVMTRRIDKSCRHHTDQDRGECLKLLDKTVQQFVELGLLDDEAYLKGMITSFRRRGLSARQIQAKMAQKGYMGDAVMSALGDHDDEAYDKEENGDEIAAITFARKRRLGPYDITQRYTPEKALAAFARAGFTYDIAQKILALTPEEIENF